MFNSIVKCHNRNERFTMIFINCLRKRWLLFLSLIIVFSVGSCVLFPAGNRLTSLEIKQSMSNRKLSAFSKWMLSNQKIGTNTDKYGIEFSAEEKLILLNATLKDSPCTNGNFVGCHLDLDVFSNYVVYSNEQICVSIFGERNTVIAYEKPGLWNDYTIAVYFDKTGVIRMQQSTFEEMLKLGNADNHKLKFIKHPNVWALTD